VIWWWRVAEVKLIHFERLNLLLLPEAIVYRPFKVVAFPLRYAGVPDLRHAVRVSKQPPLLPLEVVVER
jgi:hypothetical protein